MIIKLFYRVSNIISCFSSILSAIIILIQITKVGGVILGKLNIHFIVQMIGQLSLTVLNRPLTGSSLSLNGVSMYNEVGVVVDDGLLVVVVVGSLC